jgi:hypothetical protein
LQRRGGELVIMVAHIYDVVGSVKTHLDWASREGLFFFNQGLCFFPSFSTKARTVNPAVEENWFHQPSIRSPYFRP